MTAGRVLLFAGVRPATRRDATVACFSPPVVAYCGRGLSCPRRWGGLGGGLGLAVIAPVASDIRPRLATTALLGGVVLVRPLADLDVSVAALA